MTSTLSETAYLLPRAFFSSFLLIFLGIVVQSFKKRKYPPGPRGLPVLGNVFQLEEKIWIPFNRWKIQFGPIVYLNVFGKPLVILNTYEAAADLLDKRSNIYSDRAPNIVVRDHLTGGNGMAWMDYSDLWRRMYQVSHDALHKNAVKLYHGIQNTEALIWIQALFREPERSQVHTRRLGTSLVSSVIYGPPPLKSANDPAIALINEHGERMTIAALPFTHLVDFIPALRHLPSRMVKWKRDAEYWYEKDSRMHETMCNEAKQRSVSRSTSLG
ncbi:hypothetical protein GLOTRDRAFT_37698 [Gloeophyllum trabeum ATCC 11539]|uniref:Cytochrome P450 n=1 Tax=Gloeophyllum trabeum (strain ATCC 11539 / FP-39264 / Madison 617) TaxID=670483 RepID=S7QEE7_GLOTA|nr:uncharacterized protein GLOTRDRAFT_37698 [Gloeophyllum trabeum ATCC 11539]EPQ57683.1 hypothetical protein GLOTRDRAFT_37698 [Gloeophyllum trabeum ATCC 11539]